MSANRIAALDAARGVAIGLVVLAHALIPAMVTDIGWAVHDPAQTLAIDGAVWVIRAFVLPLFFVLSGFLAARVAAQKGLAALARRRALRLAAPLALFVVPVSMAMNALWDWGEAGSQRAIAGGAVPELEASEHAVTLGHLWFLYYLLVATAAAILLAAVARRLGARGPRAATGLLPIAAVPAVAATLWWGGKLQLDTPLGLAIDAPIALYHGVFFAWGWWLEPGELEGYGRRVLSWSAAAAALFAALLPPLIDGARPPWAHVASAGFTCTLTAAVLGACARWLSRPPAWLRALGAGSYWIYIVHLPVLVLAQVALARAAVPIAAAVPAAAALTALVCAAIARIGALIRIRRGGRRQTGSPGCRRPAAGRSGRAPRAGSR